MRLTQWLLLSVQVTAVAGDRVPTSLTCSSNAKAWRDWGFTDRRWEGTAGAPFATATPALPTPGFPLREKVFSALHTNGPTIRSITPKSGLVSADTVEFEGHVLLRSDTDLFVTWTNDVNKTWLAVIDLRNKKAVVTHTFAGLTSVGGEIETLDCR